MCGFASMVRDAVSIGALLMVGTLAFRPAFAAFTNAIQEDPTVECGEKSITVHVKTAGEQPSYVFAKGHFRKPECSFKQTSTAVFVLEQCNINRKREVNPRGMGYSLTVIVQLHPLFITKVDRAYNVRCFYVEESRDVNAELGVSDLTTALLESGHAMPQCSYTLHRDSPNGPVLRYARVGDTVYHVWECPSDVYAMLVHTCFILDGQGGEHRIIDENGCSTDDFIIPHLAYTEDSTRSFTGASVVNLPDRESVYYSCQIKLCFKKGDFCSTITPPKCGDDMSRSAGEGTIEAELDSEQLLATNAQRPATSKAVRIESSHRPQASTLSAPVSAASTATSLSAHYKMPSSSASVSPSSSSSSSTSSTVSPTSLPSTAVSSPSSTVSSSSSSATPTAATTIAAVATSRSTTSSGTKPSTTVTESGTSTISPHTTTPSTTQEQLALARRAMSDESAPPSSFTASPSSTASTASAILVVAAAVGDELGREIGVSAMPVPGNGSTADVVEFPTPASLMDYLASRSQPSSTNLVVDISQIVEGSGEGPQLVSPNGVEVSKAQRLRRTLETAGSALLDIDVSTPQLKIIDNDFDDAVNSNARGERASAEGSGWPHRSTDSICLPTPAVIVLAFASFATFATAAATICRLTNTSRKPSPHSFYS